MKQEFAQIALDMMTEMHIAEKGFAPFKSFHEGYAIILEELDELWTEIKNKPQDLKKVRNEAIQVGAMALRFIYDLLDGEKDDTT